MQGEVTKANVHALRLKMVGLKLKMDVWYVENILVAQK